MKIIYQNRRKNINNKATKLCKSIIVACIYIFIIQENLIKVKENIFKFFDNFSINITNKLLLENFSLMKENKTELLLKGKNFIDKCLKKKHITQNNTILLKPKISAIIPVYNSEKTIYSSICSIQNQNYTNFEIILIDDFSNDNSSKIINYLKEKDERIKIISNHKNMGSLYSRNIGVLMAKGEYIFGLDNDDLFFLNDIFYFILNIAQQYYFDIIGFKAIRINNYEDNIEQMQDLYNYNLYSTNIIVYQPELSTWIITKNNKFNLHDVTIWAKCIKSTIYKESIKKIGLRKYSVFVSWAEDTIMNFIIFNIAQSFLFIHKYGIIHLHNKSTASFTMGKDIKLFGELFLLDIIYNFSKYRKNKYYAIKGAYKIKRRFRNKKFSNNNNSNLVYFKSIINTFLKDKYNSNKFKNKIKKDFKAFFI